MNVIKDFLYFLKIVPTTSLCILTRRSTLLIKC